MIKGILEWFKPNIKMKRWFLLIIISIILVCYELSKVMISNELQFFDLIRVIMGFVIGFIGIVTGFVFSQRRMLELLVEASVQDENSKSPNVKSLMFNKKVFERGPKVVVIGGGTGLSTMLRGLKLYTSNITAIVTTSDDGSNTGTLRKELGIVAPGDIRQCIVALSTKEPVMENLFQYRFSKGTLSEMNFGNMYLAAMSDLYGNFAEGVRKTSEVLSITGKVLPVTIDDMNICAILEDGTEVEGETNIVENVKEKVSRIKRAYIKPTNCMPLPEVLSAIKDADAIVLGPGSLYTSILPNLLVRNVADAVKESMAMKIYVCNIMTQPGETSDYSVSEHINVIQEHFGKDIIDFCICDTGEITPEYIKKYNLDGAEPVEIDNHKVKEQGVTLIEENLSEIKNDCVRHNPNKLAKVIMRLICEDFKFNNKQGLLEYIILKHKLKVDDSKERKVNRKQKDENKEHRKEQKVKKLINPEDKISKQFKESRRATKESKFTQKYKDRIESIKNSKKD